MKVRVNASVLPTVSSYDPADEATGVAVDKNLVLTFNENVSKVPMSVGNIFIRSATAPNIVIPVTNSNVSVSGKKVTINPANDLMANSAYSVRVDAASFQDSDNNQWGGIRDDTTWNFQTAAATPTLSADMITQTGARLTIANGPGTWYYKANTGPHTACSSAQTGTTATLSGLTANTSYTYRAYSDSGCTAANELASVTFMTGSAGDTTPPDLAGRLERGPDRAAAEWSRGARGAAGRGPA